MSTSFEKPRDLVGGLVIVAIGGVFLLFGRELPVGSSFRMGPGYFPLILSWLMMAMGAVMAGLAWRAPHQEGAFGEVPWRGLLPVLLVVVFATAWASRYASLRAAVPLALGVAVFCSTLFITGLGLPLPLTGNWLKPAWWSPPAAVTAPAATAPTTPAQ